MPTRRRPRRFPPEVLTAQEVTRLMDACGHFTTIALRMRALLAVLYRSGLRISEALDLYPKDIDLQTGAVRVLHGKGDKPRTAALDPGALAMLQRWLDCRARLGFNGSQPVFCTRSGGALTSGYIRRWLPRVACRAGIEKRVHAHGLRHTHAAELCAPKASTSASFQSNSGTRALRRRRGTSTISRRWR